MRKKLSVLCTTFLLPLLMTVLAFAADSPFSDVAPDAPYAESIAYLVEHGITNGTGADTFSPDAPVTVRQWSVMLYLALCMEGEGTIPERKVILAEKKETLLQSITELQKAVAYIDWKQRFYDDVLSGKTAYYSNLVPELLK